VPRGILININNSFSSLNVRGISLHNLFIHFPTHDWITGPFRYSEVLNKNEVFLLWIIQGGKVSNPRNNLQVRVETLLDATDPDRK
jgi:hypothetical protein